MRIVIDIRALMDGRISGVTVYIKNLLADLLKFDKENEYILYYNSFHDVKQHFAFIDEIGSFSNVKLIGSRIPNVILNFMLRFFRWPKLDLVIRKLIQDKSGIDVFFMPDPRPVALSKDVKLVTTFHDLSFEHFSANFSLKTRLWHVLLAPRYLAHKSHKIIAVSEFTKSDLVRTYDIPGGKIATVYHGVASSYFDQCSVEQFELIRSSYRLPEKFILSLCTLEPRKNLMRLISAFQKFNADFPQFDLVIAGINQDDVFRCVRFPRFSWLHFPGYIKEKDKLCIYQLSSGFVYVSEYEGFGLQILEASASSCALLVSNNSALNEIAPSGAIRVDPYSVDDIVRGLTELVRVSVDDKIHKEFSDYARKFSWKDNSKKVVEIFSCL